MPPLDDRLFKSGSAITASLANQLEVASLGSPVSNTLVNLGWDGTSPVAAVGLELSPDNRHVQRAQLVLRGQLAQEPVVKQANTFWGDASSEVTLRVEVPDGSRFIFAAGGLASNYLACEELKFYFARDGKPVLPTDWAGIGVKEFAVRCICYLDKNSNKKEGPRLKYAIHLVPLSVTELQQQAPASASAAWPGFKLVEGSCAFFPGADQTGWGDPICPLLCRGSHRSEAPHTPAVAEIRFYIAAVMRTAMLATHCRSASGWKKQHDQAVANITALEREPTITWPATPRHDPPQGINLSHPSYIYPYTYRYPNTPSTAHNTVYSQTAT